MIDDDSSMKRWLAAILAADIAGYSRLMGEDEAATVRDLKGHQAVILPLVGRYNGRIIATRRSSDSRTSPEEGRLRVLEPTKGTRNEAGWA
jgi:class 3 adenylate cyclase